MSNGAVVAMIANAIKASGTLVRVNPDEFLSILRRVQDPLVVVAEGGFWNKSRYLVSYKGLAFYTKSAEPLALPSGTEKVVAQSFWMPG